MLKLNEVFGARMKEMRNRAARDFGNGEISKTTFDRICELLDELSQVVESGDSKVAQLRAVS